MRLVVASPAARDLFNAIEFYDDLALGLGQDLVDAFDSALSQILAFPIPVHPISATRAVSSCAASHSLLCIA